VKALKEVMVLRIRLQSHQVHLVHLEQQLLAFFQEINKWSN